MAINPKKGINQQTIHRFSGPYFQSSNNLAFLYNTILKNNVTSDICLYFLSCNGIVESNNIVENNSPISFGVIHTFYSPLTFSNCFFFNNKNQLFNSGGSTIIITNCHIFHENSISLTFINLYSDNLYSLTSTYHINHYETFFCLKNSGFQSPKLLISQNNTKKNSFIFLIFQFLILF